MGNVTVTENVRILANVRSVGFLSIQTIRSRLAETIPAPVAQAGSSSSAAAFKLQRGLILKPEMVDVGLDRGDLGSQLLQVAASRRQAKR